ncbi:hypothetical protein [Lacisediminihabitans changchengi]|uniref:Large exoprotein n=1 Tax=Lacisediminihabitans changchengi TaxID=2787634 RepID=A0A934SI91_9MICO|nr:hypothetical protein [Lacisediminihabitans changchengi]MBK4347152.1 hypothetical protein [Lacisediminihabitans changchengi]
MAVDGFGSSVIIALAAVLWLAYLVPTWLRRREYLSTERNAIRLQQTLRVMAEAAEIPAEVRAETTARSAAEQERLLRKHQQREAAVARAQDAAAARAAASRLAELHPAIAADVAIASPATRRLRRSRVVTSVVLLLALVATAVGVAQLIATGSFVMLVGGGIVSTGSFVMLGQLASVARARAELVRNLRARPVVVAERPKAQPQRPQIPAAVRQASWTPVPLPKPLYMSKPQADRALEASLEAAAELRQAAADARRKQREVEQQPGVTPIRPVAPVAAPSKFATMGIIEPTEASKTDLDAVLARRRRVG